MRLGLPSTGFVNPTPKVILPMGDSITNGQFGSADLAGYRSKLFALGLAAGKRMRFIGPQSTGPATVGGQPFPQNHGGYSGATIANTPIPTNGITELTPSPMIPETPDVVLLMIGVNDRAYTAGLATMTTRLQTLLDLVIAAAPKALIVLARNTPYTDTAPVPLFDAYAAGLPALAASYGSAGKRVISVDMSTMPAAMLNDGLHPNDAGYLFMANVWWAAIKDIL